jgi:hypothetical protein
MAEFLTAATDLPIGSFIPWISLRLIRVIMTLGIRIKTLVKLKHAWRSGESDTAGRISTFFIFDIGKALVN